MPIKTDATNFTLNRERMEFPHSKKKILLFKSITVAFSCASLLSCQFQFINANNLSTYKFES